VKTISDWLSDNTWYAYHQEMEKRRASNTGIWFLDSPEFQSWLRNSRGRLWATGMRESEASTRSADSLNLDFQRVLEKRFWRE